MRFRKWMPLISAVFVLNCLTACDSGGHPVSATKIALSANGVTVEGAAISSDPDDAVYLSHDVIYNKEKEAYESGNSSAEERKSGGGNAEALAVSVVNITSPGVYRLFGTLEEGQIRVDLGEKAAKNKKAVVLLILDNAHISCSVMPAILFANVYECDAEGREETASFDMDTAAAGANIILADGSTNTVGAFCGMESFEDNENSETDDEGNGAIYSNMSININGEGSPFGALNLTAGYDGIGSKRHLTVNGGDINIRAGNDGLYANGEGVSVMTVNGGNLRVAAGLAEDGIGMDSQGWLVINGGTVVSGANDTAGVGLDSKRGTYLNGGTVVALGAATENIENSSGQVTMNLQFDRVKELNSPIVLTDSGGTSVFAYDPAVDAVFSGDSRSYSGAIISCASLKESGRYHLYLGGTVSGTEVDGIYDTATITHYTGGTEQSYLDTEISSEKKSDDEIPEEKPSGGDETRTAPPPGERFVDFYLGSKVNFFFGVDDQ